MSENDITVEVKNISKAFRIYGDKSHTFKDRVLFHKRSRFEKHQVLRDISFTIHKGQAVGLIGHNGCGKSTTLKLLNRILYPDEGKIMMHGRISSLIELGAGFHPDMSGRENIYINASIFGLKKKEIDERLADIIRFSELENYIDNPVRTYSSGMYMRLAFAIAINVDADILLVDEILAVGDANFQKKCFDKLDEIKKNGATIVIVSHSMEQIKGICDRVIWIEAGRIKQDGEAFPVCEAYLFSMKKQAEERLRRELTEKGECSLEDPGIKYPPLQTAKDQCSKYANRNGDMHARFVSIGIYGDDGKRTQIIRQQQRMVVQFDIETDMDSSKGIDVIFNIFHHIGGVLCTTFGTRLKYGVFIPVEKLKSASMEIPEMMLCEGDYILDAVIEDSDGHVCDRLTHLIEFHVTASSEYGIGIAAMNNIWKMS